MKCRCNLFHVILFILTMWGQKWPWIWFCTSLRSGLITYTIFFRCKYIFCFAIVAPSCVTYMIRKFKWQNHGDKGPQMQNQLRPCSVAQGLAWIGREYSSIPSQSLSFLDNPYQTEQGWVIWTRLNFRGLDSWYYIRGQTDSGSKSRVLFGLLPKL